VGEALSEQESSEGSTEVPVKRELYESLTEALSEQESVGGLTRPASEEPAALGSDFASPAVAAEGGKRKRKRDQQCQHGGRLLMSTSPGLRS
jgi:hypothetical protein